MASLFKRFKRIFKGNVEKILDQLEDEEMTMNQIIKEYTDKYDNVTTALAKSIARSKKLEKMKERQDKELDKLNEQAKIAVSKERDDLAREILDKIILEESKKEEFDKQVEVNKEGEKVIRENLEMIDSRIEEAKRNKEILSAKRDRIIATKEVNDILKGLGTGGDDIGKEFEEIANRLESMECEQEAVSEVLKIDEKKKEIDKVCNTRSTEIEARLAVIKSSEKESEIDEVDF